MLYTHCSIEGCDCDYPDEVLTYYGLCKKCEDFGICYKQDDEHDLSLLYNEGCSKHHDGLYLICLPCALEAFKKSVKTYIVGQEHCICPECGWDFGLFQDLLYKKPE